jgi:hypothetical protein
MRRRAVIATAPAIASSGCATGGSLASPDTSQRTTPFVDEVGVPVHAKASRGATRDITLDSVIRLAGTCHGGGGFERDSCAVLELTFVGTWATPFKYDERFVTAAYSADARSNSWGGSMFIDYTAINKLPPLRHRSVSAGQTAHGFVGIPLTAATGISKSLTPMMSASKRGGKCMSRAGDALR